MMKRVSSPRHASAIVFHKGDLGPRDLAASAAFIARELAERPSCRSDLFLLVAGEAPRRITRDEGIAMLREGGMSAEARRLERALVPVGKVLMLTLTDGARRPFLGLLDIEQALDFGGGARGLLGHLAGQR